MKWICLSPNTSPKLLMEIAMNDLDIYHEYILNNENCAYEIQKYIGNFSTCSGAREVAMGLLDSEDFDEFYN